MGRLKLAPGGVKRAITISTWFYGLFLHAYPSSFRRLYGTRMVHVFRDSCRDALQRQGPGGLILLWLFILSDLVFSACLERWQVLKEVTRSMALNRQNPTFPLRLWLAIAATAVAFVVSLVASLNLYLLEDSNPLTEAAYSASPLLRFSYDGVYLTALAAGVAVCSILVYTLKQNETLVVVCLIFVTLLVAFGGFGGLLVHHSDIFLIFASIFFALTLISFLCGRLVATHAGHLLGQRSAAVLGACVGVGCMLLVNVVAIVLHTLLLNPVSHALYMQGQIEGTHVNFSLFAMGLAFLTMITCVLSLGYALHLPSHQS
jgi:hypothetical protein